MAEETPLYKDGPAGVTTGYLGYLTDEQQTALDTLKAELTASVCYHLNLYLGFYL